MLASNSEQSPRPVKGPDGLLYTSDMETRLNRLAFAVFDSDHGAQLLNYLRNITLHRVLGPEATDGEIRHLEGARWLVSVIISRMNNGKEALDDNRAVYRPEDLPSARG